MKGELKMKIVRTEQGKYTRSLTLEIDECVVDTINSELTTSLVNGVKFVPLTAEDIWKIMIESIEAPRYKEEYFIDYKFYNGVMKLGDFVRCNINDIFATLPGETEEVVDFYNDEFYP